MEWSKLKNIILLILVATNLFLLALVGSREWSAARYLSNARSDAIQVLARSGITVDKDILPKDQVLPIGAVTRDREGEAGLLEPLLGPVSEQSLGGGRFLYTGEYGVADLRGRGEFSLALDPDHFSIGGMSYAAHAVETLSLMGFQAVAVSTELLQEDSATTGEPVEVAEVTLVQLWGEAPVLTCTARAVYTGGSLVSVSGTRLSGSPVQTGGMELSAVTGLLGFLERLSDTGDVCSAVTAMTPAYQLTSGLADPAGLDPVWYMETDAGAYILNVATGELRRL